MIGTEISKRLSTVPTDQSNDAIFIRFFFTQLSFQNKSHRIALNRIKLKCSYNPLKAAAVIFNKLSIQLSIRATSRDASNLN